MREFCSYGSVRGAPSNRRPYRDTKPDRSTWRARVVLPRSRTIFLVTAARGCPKKNQTAGDADTNRNSDGHERDCFVLGPRCAGPAMRKQSRYCPSPLPLVSVSPEGWFAALAVLLPCRCSRRPAFLQQKIPARCAPRPSSRAFPIREQFVFIRGQRCSRPPRLIRLLPGFLDDWTLLDRFPRCHRHADPRSGAEPIAGPTTFVRRVRSRRHGRLAPNPRCDCRRASRSSRVFRDEPRHR